jgi:hypothetical protein
MELIGRWGLISKSIGKRYRLKLARSSTDAPARHLAKGAGETNQTETGSLP